MSDDRRPKHPSGRPIRRDPYVKLSILRVPLDSAITPRLRNGALKDAIGFHAAVKRDDDEAD
jgi:hypothetical protein